MSLALTAASAAAKESRLAIVFQDLGTEYTVFWTIVAVALTLNHVFERSQGSRWASVATGVIALSGPILLDQYTGKLGTSGVVAIVAAIAAVAAATTVKPKPRVSAA